jgi:NADPH-dependent glutamate synthase beta subunit-like oxidoreductase
VINTDRSPEQRPHCPGRSIATWRGHWGDQALKEGWQLQPEAPSTDRRTLIIGAVPSGLSAAYHQSMRGHTVKNARGGTGSWRQVHFGISANRLPRDVLMAEIRPIETLGSP